MSHVFYRQPKHEYPVAVRGEGIDDHRPRRQPLSGRQRRRRGVVPRPRSSAGDRGDQGPGRDARLRAHQLLHDRARGGARRPSDRARPRRHRAGLLRLGRLRGGRGRAQAGAPVFRRDRAAAAAPLHRAPAELSRQHAGRACGRRQRLAAAPVPAAPDRRRPRQPLLRLSRPGRGRVRRGLRPAPGRRAGGDHPGARPRDGDRASSPSRWSARPWARCRRCPGISGRCARSAIATACS